MNGSSSLSPVHPCPQKVEHFSTDTKPRMPPRRGSFWTDVEAAHKKHVRFSDDDDDQELVYEEVFVYTAVPQELYRALYWSPEDAKARRKLSKESAKILLKERPELAESILRLYGYHKRKEMDCMSIDSECAAKNLTQCDSRGLEHFLSPLVSRHRFWAINKILAIQKECKDVSDRDSVETLLRMWSLKVSEGSRLFARNIANGDEREALNAAKAPVSLGKLDLKRGNPQDAKGVATAA